MPQPENRAKALGALYDRLDTYGNAITEVCPVGLALVLNMLLDGRDKLERRVAELERLIGVADKPSAVESPWCEYCQSFHPKPMSQQHAMELQCLAPDWNR